MPEQRPRAAALTYRADVDGLRAVAVLLVVLNHLRTRLKGGYIGVDVFFVISGYLISSVILSEMAAGRFSVVRFYERRIRRIAPALLAMLAGTAALAYTYSVPSELDAFARSMLAALGSVSNFLFWNQAGYFDTPSALKPLLHTWSLGIEEQFYVVFPLLLLAIRRWFPHRLQAAVWGVTVLTFGAACIVTTRSPATAFFFAPLRAWELLFGTIVSQRYLPAVRGTAARNGAAALGLLLIVVPAAIYTAETPFPGLAALPPCVGAALLIAAGETGDSLVGRALSWRPVVFVGLISYSLYLWHWPLMVFQETGDLLIAAKPGSTPVKLAVFAASFVVAALSWRFVETPFRTGRWRPGPRALFVGTAAASAVIAGLGVTAIAAKGFPARFPPEALAVDRFTGFDFAGAFRENSCFIDPTTTRGATFASFDRAACLGDDPTRPHYLLLGDSHAAHLYPGLRAVFPELNISQATTASCRPFVAQPQGVDDYCRDMWRYIYGEYLPSHHVDAVLIAGRWADAELPELGRTIASLRERGLAVVLFGPIIEFDVPLPRLLALSIRSHAPALVERHRLGEPLLTDRKLADIARTRWQVRYISAYEDLCPSPDTGSADARTTPANQTAQAVLAGCPVDAGPGVPLLFDTDHFTPEGSIRYARVMRARHQLP
jgi:peptidoglycan/LPS O-acetylase OafA/YrhL